jgi:hypothetical protein
MGRRHRGQAAPVARSGGGPVADLLDRFLPSFLPSGSTSEWAVWIATAVLCAGAYARHGLPLATLYFLATAALCTLDPSLNTLQLLNLGAVVYDLSFELHRLYMLVSNRPLLMVLIMLLAFTVEWLLERYEAEDSNDDRPRGTASHLAPHLRARASLSLSRSPSLLPLSLSPSLPLSLSPPSPPSLSLSSVSLPHDSFCAVSLSFTHTPIRAGAVAGLARLSRSVGRMLLPAVMGVLIACVGWLILTAGFFHPSVFSAPLVEGVEQVSRRSEIERPRVRARPL